MTRHFTEQQNKEWLANLPKKSLAVKVIIKSTAGNFLLVKPTYKKTWQLPGGGVEPFEEPREAAIRELGEEMGLAVKSKELQIVGTAFRKEHDNLILIYEYSKNLDETTSFNLQQDEVEGCKFARPESVLSQLSDYYTDFWPSYLDK